MFDDKALAKQLLSQMRRRRNQYVHSAEATDDTEKLCYITKRFVDHALLRLIRNDFEVKNFAEHGDFSLCRLILRHLKKCVIGISGHWIFTQRQSLGRAPLQIRNDFTARPLTLATVADRDES